jgi:predicted metalloprotease
VSFTDGDVRSGLIAMLEVRDPVGVNQFSQGGHGSGFDRVGAFQVGFTQGLSRCAELIDDPLPLMPNEFVTQADVFAGGNAPLTFEDDGLLTFLPEDLNLYWATELDAVIPDFDGLQVSAAQTAGEVDCADLTGDFENGVALCPSTSTVYLNTPVAEGLHNQAETFGDFSIGYLLGVAWAEAAQQALGSTLVGEDRELVNDCLVGAWVQTVIPTSPGVLPLPRAEGRTATVSPGDLDEAIRTQIVIGDAGTADDEIGTPFEKIEAFRDGVLGGIEACGI